MDDCALAGGACVEATLGRVLGAIGGYHQDGIRVDVAHARGFLGPILCVVLDDAEAINPEKSEAEELRDGDGVLCCLGEL